MGKGSYGCAVLVSLKRNPSKKFVMKQVVVEHMTEKEQAAASAEAEVLNQMQHSNIVLFVESFVESSKLNIVMEYADGGDLSSFVQTYKKARKRIKESDLMRIFVQITLALKHVHEHNILHRDLKSQNIFLTRKGIVKLGDFGIAKVLENTDFAKTMIGTPYNMSPEICDNKRYGRAADLWALGIVLYELIMLDMPFNANSLPGLIRNIIQKEPPFHTIPMSIYTKSLKQLVQSLLQKNPEDRPSLRQIVRTDFLKAHISKLLSHTLKNQSGGIDYQFKPLSAEGGQAVDKDGDKDNNTPKKDENGEREKFNAAEQEARIKEVDEISPSKIDPEAMEQRIENLRRQEEAEKESQMKEDAIRHERAEKRQLEREKLRKFREEMVQNMKDGRNKNHDKDSVVIAKAPMLAYNNRVVQPISQHHHYDHHHHQQQQNVMGDRGIVQLPGARYNNAGNGNKVRVDPPPYSWYEEEEGRKVQAAQAVASGNNNHIRRQVDSDYADKEKTDIIRQQFFANRAAAAAVKARVEAEKNGIPFDLDEHSNAQQQNHNHHGPQRALPSQNYLNDDINNNNGQVAQLHPNYYDNFSAEARIAELRAKKDREKQQELAEKDRQLQLAHQENRRVNREMRAKYSEQEGKEAIAFSIEPPVSHRQPITSNGIGKQPVSTNAKNDENDKNDSGSPQRNYDRRNLDDDIDDIHADSAVLKKLHDRRAHERQARDRAKMVFQKLQEQHKSKPKSGKVGVVREKEDKKAVNAKKNAVSEEGKEKDSEKERTPMREENDGDSDSSEADSDLEATIDNWLAQREHSRNKKNDNGREYKLPNSAIGVFSGSLKVDEKIRREISIDASDTKQDAKEQEQGNDIAANDDADVNKSFEEHNDDVADLQCMLAQELLG